LVGIDFVTASIFRRGICLIEKDFVSNTGEITEIKNSREKQTIFQVFYRKIQLVLSDFLLVVLSDFLLVVLKMIYFLHLH
jgi:hypothetical protein